ncbi:MAG: nucleoside 2-deoxyribosyltransferase [Minwuia sp.]|nr:nucleoside 2-deoxyribosyltransferase [Minwuia sp.]
MSVPRLYLAGPDVFAPDAIAIGRQKQAICVELGAIGLFPLDNAPPPEGLSRHDLARHIYRDNIDLMRGADGCVANLSPFRGPNADDGTAFEVGWMIAAGKPVFGHVDDPRALAERSAMPGGLDAQGRPVDADGWWVEDFGWPVNLMLVAGIERSGGQVMVQASGAPRLDAFRQAVTAAVRCCAG